MWSKIDAKSSLYCKKFSILQKGTTSHGNLHAIMCIFLVPFNPSKWLALGEVHPPPHLNIIRNKIVKKESKREKRDDRWNRRRMHS